MALVGPQMKAEIEALVEERFGGKARLVPSGRLGLTAALKAFFERGERVAMIAPVCEVVAFSTYAAGLRPVFVDSNIDHPTIDVNRLAGLSQDEIRGVIATNLYGVPDQMDELRSLCREREWLLIEDAAQVLDSRIDAGLIGTFGDATIFSFKKYFDEACGVVICRSTRHQARLDAAIDNWSETCGWRRRLRARAVRIARSTGLRQRAGEGPQPHRTPTPENTRPSCAAHLIQYAAGAYDPFAHCEPLLRLDGAAFRQFPPPAQLERLRERLQRWDDLAGRYRRAQKSLADALGNGHMMKLRGGDACYLAVPLLTADRDAAVRRIWNTKRIRIENIYNPPLADYLPAVAYDDLRRYPERDDRWSCELLPIPTLRADACAEALRSFGLAMAHEVLSTPTAVLFGPSRQSFSNGNPATRY